MFGTILIIVLAVLVYRFFEPAVRHGPRDKNLTGGNTFSDSGGGD